MYDFFLMKRDSVVFEQIIVHLYVLNGNFERKQYNECLEFRKRRYELQFAITTKRNNDSTSFPLVC